MSNSETDVLALWHNIKGHLTTDNRISPQLWGFLDLVEPRGVMAGVLYLEVPNELTRGMLEQRVRLPLLAALVFEQHVVRSVGVEGGIQVDQIHALIGDVVAQDGKVVALEQGVLGDPLSCHRSHSQPSK